MLRIACRLWAFFWIYDCSLAKTHMLQLLFSRIRLWTFTQQFILCCKMSPWLASKSVQCVLGEVLFLVSAGYKKLTPGTSVTRPGWLPAPRWSDLFLLFSLSQLAFLWSLLFRKDLALTEELRRLKKAGAATMETALAPSLSPPAPQMASEQSNRGKSPILPMDRFWEWVQDGIAGSNHYLVVPPRSSWSHKPQISNAGKSAEAADSAVVEASQGQSSTQDPRSLRVLVRLGLPQDQESLEVKTPTPYNFKFWFKIFLVCLKSTLFIKATAGSSNCDYRCTSGGGCEVSFGGTLVQIFLTILQHNLCSSTQSSY